MIWNIPVDHQCRLSYSSKYKLGDWQATWNALGWGRTVHGGWPHEFSWGQQRAWLSERVCQWPQWPTSGSQCAQPNNRPGQREGWRRWSATYQVSCTQLFSHGLPYLGLKEDTQTGVTCGPCTLSSSPSWGRDFNTRRKLFFSRLSC